MAKIVDITNKLGFEDKPKLKIRDKEYEIDNSAVAMIEIMDKMNRASHADIIESLNILFSEEDVKYILNDLRNDKGNKITFEDLINIIMEATALVTGTEESGETVTPATT